MAFQNVGIDNGRLTVGTSGGGGGSSTVASQSIDLAMQASQKGIDWVVAGVVYLVDGTILSAESTFWMGVDNAVDDAEVELRNATTGALLATITKTGIIGEAQPGSDIVVSTAGHYAIRLRSDAADATAFLLGVHLVYEGSPAEFHGTTLSPVGSWDLNGDLTAQAGNALSVAQGTARYGPGSVLGEQGLVFSGTRLNQAHDANLAITGAVSFGCIISQDVREAGTRTIMAFGSSSGGEANNYLYRTRINAGNVLSYSHQNAGGVLNTFSTTVALPVGHYIHVMWTRAANGTDLKLYLNGVERASGSVTNAPTGGGSSRMGVGGDPTASGQNIQAQIITPVVYASELSASQVAQLANLTLPPELRSP